MIIFKALPSPSNFKTLIKKFLSVLQKFDSFQFHVILNSIPFHPFFIQYLSFLSFFIQYLSFLSLFNTFPSFLSLFNTFSSFLYLFNTFPFFLNTLTMFHSIRFFVFYKFYPFSANFTIFPFHQLFSFLSF